MKPYLTGKAIRNGNIKMGHCHKDREAILEMVDTVLEDVEAIGALVHQIQLGQDTHGTLTLDRELSGDDKK